jgi:hypothetical protein
MFSGWSICLAAVIKQRRGHRLRGPPKLAPVVDSSNVMLELSVVMALPQTVTIKAEGAMNSAKYPRFVD